MRCADIEGWRQDGLLFYNVSLRGESDCCLSLVMVRVLISRRGGRGGVLTCRSISILSHWFRACVGVGYIFLAGTGLASCEPVLFLLLFTYASVVCCLRGMWVCRSVHLSTHYPTLAGEFSS